MPHSKKFWCAGKVETQEGVGPPATLPSLLEFCIFTVMEATGSIGLSCHLNFAHFLPAGIQLFGNRLSGFLSHLELDWGYPTLSDPLHVETPSPTISDRFSAFVARLSFTFQPWPVGQFPRFIRTVSSYH